MITNRLRSTVLLLYAYRIHNIFSWKTCIIDQMLLRNAGEIIVDISKLLTDLAPAQQLYYRTDKSNYRLQMLKEFNIQ